LRIKGIITISIIVIVVGTSIVFSTNQHPPPGIQDSVEISDDLIIQLNSSKTDTIDTSEKGIISEQSTNIEK